MKKLNLGCGRDYKEGWVNVDFDKNTKADLKFDLSRKFPLKDNSFDIILAQDVLEHLTSEKARVFLENCRRVLKKSGELYIRVPDVYTIFEQFKSDPPVLMKFLYGDTSLTGDLGVHKYGYNYQILSNTLKVSGFKVVQMFKETTNIICKAQKLAITTPTQAILISGQDSAGLGGAEVHLTSLGKSFRSQGCRVSYTTIANSQMENLVAKNRFRNFSIPFKLHFIGNLKGLVKSLLLAPVVIISLLSIVRRFKAGGGNIVLISGITDKFLLTPIARLFRLSVVWIEYSPLSSVLSQNFSIPKILYRLVKPLPDAVIIPTRYAKNLLIPETRISEAKMHIIPCGIKLPGRAILARSKKLAAHKKKELGIDKKFVIGIVSRLQKEKGHDNLIKSLEYLKGKIKNISLVIVGDGEIGNLTSLTRKLKLDGSVHFLGYQDDLYASILMFDIFVFPTRWELEGFGLVLAEAMAAGVPVVTSNFGPIPEVVGDASLLVNPKKPQDIAGAIGLLYGNRKLKKALVQKGFTRVKGFNITKVAGMYLDVFRDIMRLQNG